MKRVAVLLCVVGVIAAAGSAFAQADLSVFPAGTTKMVYNIRTEDLSRAMPLELTVVSHGDGTYTVRMVTEATGTEDEVGSFGFIGGMTSVSASGHDVSYSSLQALMDQRSRISFPVEAPSRASRA